MLHALFKNPFGALLSAIPVSNVPNELWQDVQDGDEEVCDGEVVHEVVHPRRRLPPQLPLQCHQHNPVAEQGDQEDDGLQGERGWT